MYKNNLVVLKTVLHIFKIFNCINVHFKYKTILFYKVKINYRN